MSVATLMLALTLVVPALMLVACVSRRWRQRVPHLLALAPLPGLIASIMSSNGAAVVIDEARLRLTLTLDTPRAILLGTAAFLWSAAGAYASSYLKDDPQRARFAVYWLLTLTGCLGVFLSADLATFYLHFAIVSLAAFGLVVHDGTPVARRAAVIYVALAVVGEACLLLGFVLLASAAPGESLLIHDAVEALSTSPRRDQTLVFLLLGFGLKAGLVPLHGWLPLAHPAAPMPASAVLSGAIIKTGIIGLVCFLPLGVALPASSALWASSWSSALTTIGFVTAFYGVLVGITQSNPKTILAYSSVSQMGVVVAVLGVGFSANSAEGSGAGLAATYYAAHHVLVKGGLFLGVGVIAATAGRRRWWILLPTAVLALSIAGLPLTGGALAKLATKPYFGDGFVSSLATLSAIGSSLLMVHFLTRVATVTPKSSSATAPRGLCIPWLVTAIAAVATPWWLYSIATGKSASDALELSSLWTALWPIVVGGLLAIGLAKWRHRLPTIPEGDILCVGERAASAIAERGGMLEPVDRALRRWPIALATLVALTLALGAMMMMMNTTLGSPR